MKKTIAASNAGVLIAMLASLSMGASAQTATKPPAPAAPVAA